MLCPVVYAYDRGKNLSSMTEGKTIKIYLGDFKSDSDKINADAFKNVMKDFLAGRKKESFEIVADKKDSEIVIESKILAYRYLEKDPIDNVIGGTTALIVDALVPQNYVQVKVEFTVFATDSMRKLWSKKDVVSVTKTNMLEQESIPLVLKESAKRFVALCFVKRER
jgi:hypothetical protein